MPTRAYLLRHAESADPTVFHGAESDVGLSSKGERQAAAVAEYFAPRRPDLVIASNMRRARDTALPIALACTVPLHIEPDLHERRVGALSGTPTHDPEGIWQQTVQRWSSGDTGYALAGAESFDDIRARIVPVWERVTRDHAGRTLVVVAHGIVCKVLLLSILPGYSAADWARLGPVGNVAVSELVSATGTWAAVHLAQPPGLLAARGLY